jgi:mRNA interferase MazF
MVVAKHGDIVMVAGGPYTSKPRPALVIQSTQAQTGSSTVVIPFTTSQNHEVGFRVAVIPSKANGLDRGCFLEVDKISAIKTEHLSKRVGELEPGFLEQAKTLLAELLDLLG